MDVIYFDHAATTPLDEKVFDTMKPYFSEYFGNANSAHQLGRKAKVALEDSRETIACLLNAEPSEIVFTSGGTESDNAVINGVLDATGKKEIITSPIEHHAILHPVEMAKLKGVKPVYLQPDNNGMISAKQVADAITDNTALVSLMHVNNEIGSINPLREIAAVCKEKNIPFHSDTVQSVGKIPVDVKELGIDFLSISAHKIYGPKGVGVMYIRNGAPWIPWLHGGSQERRRRGGTSNVAGIVGMTKALEMSVQEMAECCKKFDKLREAIIDGLNSELSGQFKINGPENSGVPHIINIACTTADGSSLDGEMLLLNLDIEDICVSNGSACTSGALDPSHVLKGLGLSNEMATSSIRISFGKHNTVEEVEKLITALKKILAQMKPAVKV
jgi:cysteine desulfurase